MLLVRTKPHKHHGQILEFNVICCSCNRSTNFNKSFADLDGEPFISYYCPPCVDSVKKKQTKKG